MKNQSIKNCPLVSIPNILSKIVKLLTLLVLKGTSTPVIKKSYPREFFQFCYDNTTFGQETWRYLQFRKICPNFLQFRQCVSKL